MPERCETTPCQPAMGPSTPSIEAARAVLSLRLDSVDDRVEVAAERGEFDPRAVHQMRVATRRAAAAVRVFESLLTERIVRRIRKALRRIRKSGEQARRCDVFNALLSKRLSTSSGEVTEACAYALGRVHAERVESQSRIRRTAESNALRNLRRARKAALCKLAVDRAPDDATATLNSLAARVLPAAIEALRESVSPEAAAIESIHAQRLAGKRLRYDIEILSYAAEDEQALEHPIAALKQLQNQLGLINDLSELVNLLAAWIDEASMESTAPQRIQDGLHTLLEQQQSELAKLRDQFVQSQSSGAIAAMADRIAVAFGFVGLPQVVVLAGSDARSSAGRAADSESKGVTHG